MVGILSTIVMSGFQQLNASDVEYMDFLSEYDSENVVCGYYTEEDECHHALVRTEPTTFELISEADVQLTVHSHKDNALGDVQRKLNDEYGQ